MNFILRLLKKRFRLAIVVISVISMIVHVLIVSNCW